ncbi:MAG: hypothetical protein ABSC17_03040 [Thermacetogeniaceae bacterium]
MHEENIHEEAVSRTASLAFVPPLAAVSICELVSCLLLKLADGLQVEGIVPGHIKVLLRDDGQYAMLSCTRPGRVSLRSSTGWNEAFVAGLQVNLNVIVYAVLHDQVSSLVASCWSEFLAGLKQLPYQP